MESERAENDDELEESCKDNVQILKNTVVNDSNMDLIKSKLQSTSQYRLKMLEDKSIDLLENFPYFFANPMLVRENSI